MSNRHGAYQKKQLNIENVYARYKLLVSAIAAPNEIGEALMKSLDGQRKFASLSIPGTKIQSLSLNTLKAIANEILATEAPDGDGFAYIDDMRCKLKDRVKSIKPTRTTASQSQRQGDEIKLLKHQLQQVELMNLQRSKAYHDLFCKVVSITTGNAIDEVARLRLMNIIKNHQTLFAQLLSPTGEQTSNHGLRVITGDKIDD